MDWIKVLTAVGLTVVSSDSSIPYWRYVIGLSTFWTNLIVIFITSISSTIIFYLGGMIGRKKKPRKKNNLRVHRKVRASIYLTRKRFLAKIARNYGLPVAICIAASWPTPLGGLGVHLSALVIISRTRDKKLLIAYLLGNAIRILFTNALITALVKIWNAL